MAYLYKTNQSQTAMKIVKDKLQHFIVCIIVAAIIATIVANTCALPFPSCMAGFLGATACGIGKEYGDSKSHGNNWSWPDLAANIAGAVIGCFAGFVALLI